MENKFLLFHIYTLMPHNMIIIYFRYLISQRVLYFLNSTSVLSFHINVVLALFFSIHDYVWWRRSMACLYAVRIWWVFFRRISVTNPVCEWRCFTHWGRDKMAAIFLTTFWNAFSWTKTYEFRFRFYWNLFLGVQLTIYQHWFRWWLGAVQPTSHYLGQWWLVYRRVYASLGLNEIKHSRLLFSFGRPPST